MVLQQIASIQDSLILAMRKIIILITIFLFTVNISAKEKCELTLDSSPTLQKLKLGISPKESSSILGIKVKVKSEGQRAFFKNYIKKKAKGNLTGIRALFLRFYNAKLYQIEIFYEKDYRWQNLEEFLTYYSSNNSFSKDFWKTKYGYSKATCKGFSLNADYILNPHIQLTDDAIAEIVEKERAEKAKKDTK